ncbi:MAG: hypothetical protein NTW86_19940 [Candidatus Sumerlaeota bacterium]|nr:hypothetical protein [Candidatus Sumerlaeota bacterium]
MPRVVSSLLSLLQGSILLAALAVCRAGFAEDAVRPGALIEERPTLQRLGVRWTIVGDDNGNARVEVSYRKAGESAGGGEWRRGLDLFRTTGNWKPDKAPGAGESLFAGSVFGLEENTDYELRLNLVDPDGGAAEKTLKMKTRATPRFDKPARVLHVVPGAGGGAGTEQDPWRGLEEADRNARPGDLFLVHQGAYKAPWTVANSGAEGTPIVWRASGDGEALIDGGEAGAERGISAAAGLHDVWFEGLSVRRVKWGIVLHESVRCVVSRCKTRETEYGLTATRHSAERPCLDLYVADNDMVGPSVWPRSKGIENARGIQVSGLGHVVCHNHIRGFADAIDTFDSPDCSSIDIYRNDLEALTDDGIECDYSQHNVCCFENRMVNVFQGISEQPIHGGPVYIFRNVMRNVEKEPFKMHNSPSGALLFHNTSVKAGMPLLVMTNAPVSNFVTRNNLFLGGAAPYAFETTAPMRNCDFAYDGFGGEWKTFLKWNGTKYVTMEEAANAGIYKNTVRVDPERVFAAGDMRPQDPKVELAPATTDIRLAEGSAAIDAGERLFNINDDFAGQAPDLGAIELGRPVPHYGPR